MCTKNNGEKKLHTRLKSIKMAKATPKNALSLSQFVCICIVHYFFMVHRICPRKTSNIDTERHIYSHIHSAPNETSSRLCSSLAFHRPFSPKKPYFPFPHLLFVQSNYIYSTLNGIIPYRYSHTEYGIEVFVAVSATATYF